MSEISSNGHGRWDPSHSHWFPSGSIVLSGLPFVSLEAVSHFPLWDAILELVESKIASFEFPTVDYGDIWVVCIYEYVVDVQSSLLELEQVEFLSRQL